MFVTVSPRVVVAPVAMLATEAFTVLEKLGGLGATVTVSEPAELFE